MEVLTPTHAGGVVIGDGGTLALVHNEETRTWTFPKGSIEAGETDVEAARREVEEESGLHDLELIDDLGFYARESTQFGVDKKVIHFYLFAAPAHASITPAHEIREALWVPIHEVTEKLTVAKDKAWFSEKYDRIQKAIQRD